VVWPLQSPPTCVLAICQDVNGQSPSNLAAGMPDWITLARGNTTLIRVRNIPGLLPSTNYVVTLVVF